MPTQAQLDANRLNSKKIHRPHLPRKQSRIFSHIIRDSCRFPNLRPRWKLNHLPPKLASFRQIGFVPSNWLRFPPFRQLASFRTSPLQPEMAAREP
jgi:hypothetical protein